MCKRALLLTAVVLIMAGCTDRIPPRTEERASPIADPPLAAPWQLNDAEHSANSIAARLSEELALYRIIHERYPTLADFWQSLDCTVIQNPINGYSSVVRLQDQFDSDHVGWILDERTGRVYAGALYHAPVPTTPHGPDPRESTRAAGDLIRVYGGNDDTEIGRRAHWAGQGHDSDATYLLAMATQTLADEAHGRWASDKYYPGHEASRERKRIANVLGGGAGSDACLDLVLWFIDNDPNDDNVTKVAPALSRIPGAAKPEILGRLIDHPNDAVATTAISIAGRNHVAALAESIAALTGSYREALRDAARGQAAALQFKPLEFQPEKAFTPWLEKQLEIARARVIVAIPRDAPWRHFTYADRRMTVNGAAFVTDFGGWLLDQTADDYRLIDWTGMERTLAKADTKVAERTLAEDVAILIRGRERQAYEIAPERAEFMVGAWLCEQGNHADAARLLFPLLDAAKDQRRAFSRERDAIALQYRAEMLNAFSGQGNYPAAARIARHLGNDAFDGWRLQAEARELAAQLARRNEDFVTLKLPGNAEWMKLKTTLTRAQQTEYLAARLHLINAWNAGRWHGLDHQQYAESPARFRPPRGQIAPATAINPCRELRAMKLDVAEVRALLPRLLDEDFLPMSELYAKREGWPLLRVKVAAADIVNLAAGKTIVDLAPLEVLNAAEKSKWFAEIAAWVDGHSAMSRADVMLESLRTAKSHQDLYGAAAELAVLNDKRATPILIERYNEFGTDQQGYGSEAMLLYHLDPDGSVGAAREWLKSADYHLRFWAAMILVHSGDRSAGEGWPELLGILREHNDNQFVPHAFDTLLASSRGDARAFAISVLKNEELMQWDGASYVHRLLLAGRKEALDYEMAQLDDANPLYEVQGVYQTQAVTRMLVRADEAATDIGRWRTDGFTYARLAPDNVRQAERAKLKKWLTDQFGKITAGKPSDLTVVTKKLISVQWAFPPD